MRTIIIIVIMSVLGACFGTYLAKQSTEPYLKIRTTKT